MIIRQQRTAGDGAFLAGMITRFRENIEKAPHRRTGFTWAASLMPVLPPDGIMA